MTEDAESNNLSDVRNRENVADMFILEPDIGLGDHIIANSKPVVIRVDYLGSDISDFHMFKFICVHRNQP